MACQIGRCPGPHRSKRANCRCPSSRAIKSPPRGGRIQLPTAIVRGRSHQPFGGFGRLHAHDFIKCIYTSAFLRQAGLAVNFNGHGCAARSAWRPYGRNTAPADLKGAKIQSVIPHAYKRGAVRQVPALRQSCSRPPTLESGSLSSRGAHVDQAIYADEPAWLADLRPPNRFAAAQHPRRPRCWSFWRNYRAPCGALAPLLMRRAEGFDSGQCRGSIMPFL